MSEPPLESPHAARPADARTDADDARSVSVRLTESATCSDPTITALYEVDATIEFRSVAAAFAFEERLNRDVDDQEYLLTPDHRSDATFFLRCQLVDR